MQRNHVPWSAQVTIGKYQQGGFNNSHVSSQSSGGWNSQITAPMGGLWRGFASQLEGGRPLTICSHGGGERREISLSLLRPPVLQDQGSTIMTSLNLNYFLKTLSPNTVTLGVNASTDGFGEDAVSSQQHATFSLSVSNFIIQKRQSFRILFQVI